MEKLNISEILKDCPKGTKLYSLVHGEVELTRVGVECIYCIPNYLKHYEIEFNLDGRWIENMGECILFPSKENRDWTKFQGPFKDGDVVVCTDCYEPGEEEIAQIYILKYQISENCGFCYTGYDFKMHKLHVAGNRCFQRHATEEEKEKLFKAIKDAGYKWNAKIKTLEKLIEPKFKVGDRIKKKGDTRLITIKDVRDNYYIITIPDFFDNCYITDKLSFSNQNDYELVPNKFDITTLKPFDKVLVRDTNEQKWTVDMFSFYDKDCVYPFSCIGHYTNQCIPYKGNEHLLGTTNNCNEYFKTWK